MSIQKEFQDWIDKVDINSEETINIKGKDIPLYKKNNETIKNYVRKILTLMFENALLSDKEIRNLLEKKYCSRTFGISFPIISKNKNIRYWKDKIDEYYICSQWAIKREDTYKTKLSNWIKKVKRINDGEEVVDEYIPTILKPIPYVENKEVLDISKQLQLVDEHSFKEFENKLLQEQLQSVISTLPIREQEVIKMRFGLNNSPVLTHKELAKHFNVTPKQIMEIEAKALRRLRHPKRSRKLKDYLDH